MTGRKQRGIGRKYLSCFKKRVKAKEKKVKGGKQKSALDTYIRKQDNARRAMKIK